MPGNGTFNLTAFFRAMGIKNPEPQMRESVQPVLVVGDFSRLTPQHIPPTELFGGSVSGVAGRLPIIQITSRAAGGSLISMFMHSTTATVFYSTGARQAGLSVITRAWQQSVDPIVSLVEAGTVLANPGNTAISPRLLPINISTGMPQFPFWLSPGTVLFFWSNVVAGTISGFSLQVMDLPASQPPE